MISVHTVASSRISSVEDDEEEEEEREKFVMLTHTCRRFTQVVRRDMARCAQRVHRFEF